MTVYKLVYNKNFDKSNKDEEQQPFVAYFTFKRDNLFIGFVEKDGEKFTPSNNFIMGFFLKWYGIVFHKLFIDEGHDNNYKNYSIQVMARNVNGEDLYEGKSRYCEYFYKGKFEYPCNIEIKNLKTTKEKKQQILEKIEDVYKSACKSPLYYTQMTLEVLESKEINPPREIEWQLIKLKMEHLV